MAALDLPPGIGLVGTPLATFRAPLRARKLATRALIIVIGLGAVTWASVARHPYRYNASTQAVLPVAFAAIALLGFSIRRAQLAVTRDRAGVLYAITHTLAELGLDISLAKVSTEGEKVADVFYVNELDGSKIAPGPRFKAVREALLAAITEGTVSS